MNKGIAPSMNKKQILLPPSVSQKQDIKRRKTKAGEFPNWHKANRSRIHRKREE